MMIFIIEAIILCALFHGVIYLTVKLKPEVHVYGYPPAIVDRLVELGKAQPPDGRTRLDRLKKKWPVAILIGIILGAIVYYLNGSRTFISGFLISYGLWLIVDWYDALVIDCLWFCRSPSCVIPGTEDMVDVYHDYGYHIKSSLVGMIIGLPVCLMIGLTVQVLSLL